MNPYPSPLRAGDSYSTTRDWPDYPASEGWQLSVTLVSSAGAFTVDATAAGSAHVLAVGAAVTAGWPQATYRLVEYVTRGADRHTLHVQGFVVLPNLAAATAGLDTRGHARKVLDQIEAYLERPSVTNAEVELFGRRLKSIPVTELLVLRDRYRVEARRESGASVVSTLYTRFG